jgi:hypothetical protein
MLDKSSAIVVAQWADFEEMIATAEAARGAKYPRVIAKKGKSPRQYETYD